MEGITTEGLSEMMYSHHKGGSRRPCKHPGSKHGSGSHRGNGGYCGQCAPCNKKK